MAQCLRSWNRKPGKPAFFVRILHAKMRSVFLGRTLDGPIQRVVLIHRLREVVAKVGFTRFESATPDTEGELDVIVRRSVFQERRQWQGESRSGSSLTADYQAPAYRILNCAVQIPLETVACQHRARRVL